MNDLKEKIPTFDAARPIAVKLRTDEGVKTLSLRFPSDAEWIERQSKLTVVTKQLGRGMSETLMSDSSEYDAELVKSLQSGDPIEVDPYEATRILEELSKADVDDVSSGAEGYRVRLRVPGALVTHILKMPTGKDIFKYRRGFVRTVDQPVQNKQFTSFYLAAAAELYKRVRIGTEGYDQEPPIIHQAKAVKAIVDFRESDLGVAGDENF